jgi:hypothetical protein
LKERSIIYFTQFTYEIQNLIDDKGSFSEIIFFNQPSGKIVQRGRHFELGNGVLERQSGSHCFHIIITFIALAAKIRTRVKLFIQNLPEVN